jgi:hypothetical protein
VKNFPAINEKAFPKPMEDPTEKNSASSATIAPPKKAKRYIRGVGCSNFLTDVSAPKHPAQNPSNILSVLVIRGI